MRIGMVTPYAWSVPGGVNDHVLHLARELEARGHDVWVLAPWGRAGSSAEVEIPGRFVWMGSSVGVRSNGSRAHISTWPFMLSRMESTLDGLDLDVLHVHEPLVPAVAAAAVLRASSAVVGTFHAAVTRSAWCAALRPMANRIVSSLDARIAVSAAAREYPGSRFPGEFAIIPNGIDLERFRAKERQSRTSGRIVFIGRPDARKGLRVLLSAFPRVKEVVPEATLHLVGPTREQAMDLLGERDARALEKAGIRALGRVRDADKLADLAAAEVVCAPSLGGESFGVVLLEGMAAGALVVASDLPGYRSVLGDGRCGLLMEPGDADALAAGLLRALLDDGLRERLRRAASREVEHYAWGSVADEILSVYRAAIGSRGVARGRRQRRRLLRV